MSGGSTKFQAHRIQSLPGDAVIAFVNGIKVHGPRGLYYLYLVMPFFLRRAKHFDGCLVMTWGLCLTFREGLTLSYWRDMDSINRFVRSPDHQKAVQFVVKHPDQVTTYQEIYPLPPKSAVYDGAKPFGGLGLAQLR